MSRGVPGRKLSILTGNCNELPAPGGKKLSTLTGNCREPLAAGGRKLPAVIGNCSEPPATGGRKLSTRAGKGNCNEPPIVVVCRGVDGAEAPNLKEERLELGIRGAG